ncbi:MAG: hypothetical protein ABR968_14505 [Bacteroidales bacterium]|jgi:hypothetical protein
MRKIFIFLLVIAVQAGYSQNMERKIIIENNNFYYTTIDKGLQIATLLTGKVSDSLISAKHFALPAGRNYQKPIIPFSWDICNNMFYANNFLDNAQNDKRNSLRRFSMTSIQEWDSTVTINDMLMMSMNKNKFASNAPYSFIKRNVTTILKNFYFDGIAMNDSLYCMAITNNGELTIWNYDGRTWKHGEIIQFAIEGYFTLFAYNKQLYMLLNNGSLYAASLDSLKQVQQLQRTTLNECTLIINRDDNTVKFISNSSINYKIPLDKLIKDKAVQIF